VPNGVGTLTAGSDGHEFANAKPSEPGANADGPVTRRSWP
jgi:hypothetical protein